MTLIQKIIRKLFGEKSTVFYYLLAFQYYWRPPFINIDKILDNYSKEFIDIDFLQIGSNDGKSGDPIYNYVIEKNWNGVLVEPVNFLFEQLKITYSAATSNVYFENAAIGKANGFQTFYRLQKAEEINAPQWYDQLGSFDKSVLLKHKKHIPAIEDFIIEEKVKTITVKELLKKYTYKKINVLHIDTEGYDFEILKTFPFEALRPDLILFEHKHLKEKDFKNCFKLLKGEDYILYSNEWDTLALQRNSMKKFPGLLKDSATNFSRFQKINLWMHNKLVN